RTTGPDGGGIDVNPAQVFVSRWAFLRFLAGRPLAAAIIRGTHPESWGASLELFQQPEDFVISNPTQAINVFDFEAAARKALPPAHWGRKSSHRRSDEGARRSRLVPVVRITRLGDEARDHQTCRPVRMSSSCADRGYPWRPEFGNGTAPAPTGHAPMPELPHDRSAGASGTSRPEYSHLRHTQTHERPHVPESSGQRNRKSGGRAVVR